MQKTVIQTRQLTRKFGSLTAVRNLNLSVPQGCVYGFLGPNGAGKTTTIRMLLGLLRSNNGEIELFGEKLRNNRQNILKKVGSLVESPSLYPNLTGQENIKLYTLLLDLKPTEIDRVLEIVNLQKAAQRPVRTYSTGMRQRLGLAIALLGKPSLLILDEPTNGLDPSGIFEMRELLKSMPEAFGMTIFLSSHLLNEIEQVATQIGVINQGRLIFQGSAQKLEQQLAGNALIKVDKPKRAVEILRNLGWQVEQKEHQILSLVCNDSLTLAQANTQLVMQGINVSHLSQQKRSLEDIFFSLINHERK